MRATRLFLSVVMLLAFLAEARPEVPEAARQDPRFALGYLVVTHYPGVMNDGTGDSTKGIQQAMDDGWQMDMTVLFPAGTYVISETLRSYEFQLFSAERAKRSGSAMAVENPSGKNAVLVGDATERPVIKLSGDAKGFDDAQAPRPLIAFRNFIAKTPEGNKPPTVNNPMQLPEGFSDGSMNLFGVVLCNINFDCSGKPGAIGVSIPTAQVATLANVSVNAEGSYAGIHGIPGRSCVSTNIEVKGGQHGLIIQGSIAGAVLAGLKLENQTGSPLVNTDFVPLAVVGFDIKKASGPAIIVEKDDRMANGPLTLVDGQITVEDGATAIDNSVGKALYLRNVFVKGAKSVVASGSQEPVAALPGWTRVAEYAYTDQTPNAEDDPPYENLEVVYRMFSVIDGKISQEPQPVVSVDAEEKAPPADIMTRHILRELPLYTGQEDGTIVVTAKEYGATPDDESDDLAAIQKAIEDAALAGHGRVFVPRGSFLISNTLELQANTVLMGAGGAYSEITAHPSWIPAKGENAVLVRTVDDALASTTTGFILFRPPYDPYTLTKEEMLQPLPAEKVLPRNRFIPLHWMAGRNSAMIETRISSKWLPLTLSHSPVPMLHITGNGGGRFYSTQPRVHAVHRDNRPVLIEGTHEPLTFYGLNTEKSYAPDKGELGGGDPNVWLDANAAATNIEIRNSKNIRIFSVKREGSSPTVIILDCENIAMFVSGAMRNPTHRKMGGYIQVFGDSKDILAANVIVQHAKSPAQEGKDEPLLNEAITGQAPVIIDWPEGFSIYKRGNFSDDVFEMGAAAKMDNNETGKTVAETSPAGADIP